jgi:hypothetical protein
MYNARMPLWKRVLLRSVGFGAGFALMLCIVAAGWYWYKSRPQAWNTGAIKARYASLEIQPNNDGLVVAFGYDLESTMQSNYVVDKSKLVLLARLSDTNALSKSFGDYQSGEPTIEAPAFIPAKGIVRLDIHVPYSYAGLNAPNDKDDVKKLDPYVRRRVKALAGLVMFDQVNHYQIDMPSGWQNWKD